MRPPLILIPFLLRLQIRQIIARTIPQQRLRICLLLEYALRPLPREFVFVLLLLLLLAETLHPVL